ncbi:MAG: Na+/H+ antiporter NhaC family protein [Candidatus Cloacimonetes bacterium]|nr:Na+/H+ antiporter NhaC family protein [Candidatus Cloacimonadota bacterium]
MSRMTIALLSCLVFLIFAWSASPSNIIGTGWSLVPPVATIVLAFLTKEVITALVAGAFLGCFLIGELSLFSGYTTVLQYFVDGLKDLDKVKIIFFSLGLGGLISFCNQNGGMAGVVSLFTRFAKGRASAQLSTWALGICIFFDDYASSLVVGNTMRPTTDRMRISREKLAYIVDATSAPIACIAPISTWIANQLGLFGTQIAAFPALGAHFNSYALFLAALPFSFYAFFSILMMFTLAITGREFGPMLHCERQVLKDGAAIVYGDKEQEELENSLDKGRPGNPLFALLPIATVLSLTMGVLYRTGSASVGADAPLRDIISSGSTGTALVTAAYGGCLVAIILGLWDRRFSLTKVPTIFLTGSRAMVDAVLVLSLSWLLGRVCLEIGTATFVAAMVKTHVSYALIPTLVFLFSSLIAFATGTSWGTMGIMIPIVLGITPLHDPSLHGILLPSVAAILAGASLGDHCSPISDTTVLSSIASKVDVLSHVRTQIPYAGLVGLACIAAYLLQGLLQSSTALPAFLVGCLVVLGGVRLIGVKVVN